MPDSKWDGNGGYGHSVGDDMVDRLSRPMGARIEECVDDMERDDDLDWALARYLGTIISWSV